MEQFFSLGIGVVTNTEEAFYPGLEVGYIRSHHVQSIGERGNVSPK